MSKNSKKITVKEYIKKVQETEYLPTNLKSDEDSQRLLEGIRNVTKEEAKGNLRLFANNVTKYWFYPPEGLSLLKFVDNHYFTRVILYFLFTNIVENLIVNRRRKTIDLNLRVLLDEILENYFSTKKIKKKSFDALSDSEKRLMIDQFIANFWFNLLELDLVDRSKSGIITLKQEATFMVLDSLITIKFRDYPCVYTPKPWDVTGKNGGYYTIPTAFVSTKPTYMGKLFWSENLLNLINKLQQLAWTLDFPLEYIKTDFTFKEDKVLFEPVTTWQKKKKRKNDLKEKEDIVQHLHTRFFIEKFAAQNKHFYYPYTLDFRGRIYPLCSWGYSVTSSKKLRHCIRTPEEYILTESGKFWLKVYLANILKIEENSYANTVKVLDSKQDMLSDIIEALPNNYTKYLAKKIYEDINRGLSNILVQFDATSSVYQIIGIIINDKKLMDNTNLLDTNFQENKPNLNFVYKDIYSYIENICKRNLPNDVYNIFMDRALFKGLLMPLIYGKTMKKCVADLAKHLHKIELLYISGELHKNKELYDLYKTMQSYPIKSVLSELPEPLQQNFKEILNSADSQFEVFKWKKWYMSHVFYNLVYNTLYTEFPKLQEFKDLFVGKTPIFKHSTYTTPYYSFENKHRKTKTYRVELSSEKKKRREFSFLEILDVLEKKTTGEAANCVHSLDAFIMHYILDHRDHAPIIPIHDCIMVHPNDADFILSLINEAYTALQTMLASHPVFSQFHAIGSVPITSRNIFKFEYKEVKSYQEDIVPNELIDEDTFSDEEQ